MKTHPLSIFMLLIAWMMAHSQAFGLIAPPQDLPCPNLIARDITEVTDSHQVRLAFPTFSNVDPSTFSDGDLTLIGTDGFREEAKFVSYVTIGTPLPINLRPFPDDEENPIILPQPGPIVIATYSFSGPGNSWDSNDNGSYRVRLNADSISNRDGRTFPAKFLGGIRCLIDDVDPVTIQPTNTEIQFRRLAIGDTVQYFADVTLTFPTRQVRIDWGELQRTRDGFIAPITAVRFPSILPLDPIIIESADQVAALNETGLRPIELPPIPFPARFRHTYRLGELEAGSYRFVASVNNNAEGTETLVVPSDPPLDEDAPKAALAVRNIMEPSIDPHQFVVTYKDRAGVDVTTLGDSDIIVFSPCIGLPDLADDACPSNWKAQKARLVSVMPLDRRMTQVKVTYEVEPPFGEWTARSNGFYPIVWERGEVCDLLGNCNAYQRLGGFEVAIDDTDPPIKAEAQIRVDASDASNVIAKVNVRFSFPHNILSQSIRRDGNRIYLLAQVEPNPLIDPVEPITQENFLYEIGPLRRGEYFAGFLMNGHLYDRETFTVNPAPPIPANVDLSVNSSDPENVSANVRIAFRTPHRLEKGDIVREGHRIILQAKAEPLPIPLDPDAIIPVPVIQILEYTIGELPPGGYLASFVMNDFRYATESFIIDDPGPPIPAEVRLGINQSDPENSIGAVGINFETPHFISSQETRRIGNRFLFIATTSPSDDPAIRPASSTILRYPLGDLPEGNYSAVFVMNGFPYATTTWTEPDTEFNARVDLDVEQGPDGNWIAKTRIEFENPQIRITDPGEVTINGSVLMINATAELTVLTDAPGPFEFTYDLGTLSPGSKWLKFFINGNQEAREDFVVPAIPARVDLKFDTLSQPSSAEVTIQFRDHYRVTNQRIRRLGNLIILQADAEGPLPILAPIPPPPITLEYDLGELEPGTYIGGFMMNGHLYAYERFEVESDSFEAEVTLTADTGDTTTVTAEVDFKDPFVQITDPGTPQRTGNIFRINATADRVTFVAPPSGDPQTVEYDLGELRPGRYLVIYSINGQFEARAYFGVPEVCEPLPNLASIRVGEDEEQWFSKVALVLSPGQQVIDWGTVRQSQNEFHVNITVACIDSPVLPVPVDPVPVDELPEGMIIDLDGKFRIGGAPIRLVSHLYRLGDLSAGNYKFFVHSRSQTLGCERFQVEGAPPRVQLSVESITEATDEHSFRINFSDRSGLDHDSIQDAKVWITGPDNYREEATLVDYGSTDDEPSTGGFGRYTVNGPGGSWDRPDNGGYRVLIEADKIRDLQGNTIEQEFLGAFRVRILAQPDPGVNVTFSRNAEGNWQANVEIISEPDQQVVVDAWGPLTIHGHSFIALATVHIEETTTPVEPVAHSYDLGPLQPGFYAFVFKTNLAHCGIGSLNVPGVEGNPIDRWAAQLRLEQSRAQLLQNYFFAVTPGEGSPFYEAEIVEDEDGKSHLGIRYRRLIGAEGISQKVQASAGLDGWDDVSDEVDIVERTLDPDGTEEILICLRQSLGETDYKYLRLSLEEDE